MIVNSDDSALDTGNQDPVSTSSNYPMYPNQVAGHGFLLYDPKNCKLYKPSIAKEIQFYYDAVTYMKVSPIHQFLPSFYGSTKINGIDFAVLEDLTSGYVWPCIMDIKIGRRTFSNDADEEKRIRAEVKTRATTSFTLYFRICGIKTYDKERAPLKWNKDSCTKITVDSTNAFLTQFFAPLPQQEAISVITCYIDSIAAIESAINATSCEMYSSSLLFIYDAFQADHQSKPTCHMIDFVHSRFIYNTCDTRAVTPGDLNYTIGLSNLRSRFISIKSSFDKTATTIKGKTT